MTATKLDIAAADLSALIAKEAEWPGLLTGVEAEVVVDRGRALLITVAALPAGSVERTHQGLSPTALGARITKRLHDLARTACRTARVVNRTEIRIRPAALVAAVAQPERKAS